MDVWLPFHVSKSAQVCISIAWIVASCVRTQRHRDAVTQWLPPSDRAKETKGKRGWERPDVGKSNAPGRSGGWLVRNLNELLKNKDFKVSHVLSGARKSRIDVFQVQEAALSALAAVTKDTPSIVSVLRRSPADGDSKRLASLQRNCSPIRTQSWQS
jgi:hypothetical protein